MQVQVQGQDHDACDGFNCVNVYHHPFEQVTYPRLEVKLEEQADFRLDLGICLKIYM